MVSMFCCNLTASVIVLCKHTQQDVKSKICMFLCIQHFHFSVLCLKFVNINHSSETKFIFFKRHLTYTCQLLQLLFVHLNSILIDKQPFYFGKSYLNNNFNTEWRSKQIMLISRMHSISSNFEYICRNSLRLLIELSSCNSQTSLHKLCSTGKILEQYYVIDLPKST